MVLQLTEAVAVDDIHQASEMLDDLKGSAGTLCIDKVASLAERLEEQLRNKDKEGEKSFQLLTQELQAIEGAIAQLRPEDAANLDPADIHSANDEESLAGEHRVGAMEVDVGGLAPQISVLLTVERIDLDDDISVVVGDNFGFLIVRLSVALV